MPTRCTLCAVRFLVYGLFAAALQVAFYAATVFCWHSRADVQAAAPPSLIARAAAVADEATLLFAGDTAEIDAAQPILTKRGLLYPFGSTFDLVRNADVAVANAEAPITDGGTRFPIYKDWIYRAPAASAQALADAGFDVITLANNHATDYGRDGLLDTVANIERAGMAAIGAGRDAASARRGVVVDVGGIRVGLLAYAERQFFWDVYVGQFARARTPGVAMAAEPDLPRDVARLRARADLVVVSFHGGDNYAPPRPSMLRWSRRAVDAGADLVVNHHPHVAHPVAMWRGRPILLSLGNYAFGTPGRFGDHPLDDTLDVGLLALVHARRCTVGVVFDRVDLLPINVQNDRVNFRPEPLYGAALSDAIARLRALSARYGAAVSDGADRAILQLPGCAK
jgi:poly-gamma-glutamate synthesis protein (capsule biosynthesis protein)